MTVAGLTTHVSPTRPAPAGPRQQFSATPDDLARFFRDNYPILLDGAGAGLPRRRFLNGAESSLAGCPAGALPQAVLREALELVQSTPRPATPAGAAVVGPKAARVWWDGTLLRREDDDALGFTRPRPILRFFDVTGLGLPDPASPESGPHHEMFDIDVDLASGGKTVQFWQAARTYGVNLGLLRSDGAFSPLARLGVLRLPSDGPAAAKGTAELVRTNLRPGSREDYRIAPDAAALAWVAARPDFPGRDIQAELTLHMLYRSFLADGPGSLRRRVFLSRRDDDVLAAEYAARRTAGTKPAPARPAPAFLVAVLDAGRPVPAARSAFSPAALTPAPELPVTHTDFAWLAEVLAFARSGTAAPLLPASQGTPGLVRSLAPSRPEPFHHHPAAEPVFQAAGHLRARLASLQEEAASTPAAPAESPEAASAPPPHAPAASSRPLVAGAEPARLARAGVRVTRLSLSIEGRMRPGSRLRVAGKLVNADADGNFRLECLLTGRRAAVPVRAGDAVSSITVNWEKRPLRAKSHF